MDTRAQKLWQRGMVHFRQGNLEAAQANFEAILAREPGSNAARFRISLVHARRGRYLAAIAWANQALLDQPNQIEVLTHLARCHLSCGQPEIARNLALRALALPRDNAVALDSLGVVMSRLDESALAMELFDQAIALEPGNASMLFNRAIAQKQLGMAEAAERGLEACLALNPGHAKAHWNLAVIRTQDLASNHLPRLRQAIHEWPSDDANVATMLLALFKELDDMADHDGAWAALQRAQGARNAVNADAREMRACTEALTTLCDERFFRQRPAPADASGALVFVFGMPRSGVALLGSLLSRHSRVQHLGSQQPFLRALGRQLGLDSTRHADAALLQAAGAIDFEALGSRYLAEVSPMSGKQLIVCESHPMNFLLAGFIARALPGARMLHVMRDPVDTCVSIMASPGGEAAVAVRDPAQLAACYVEYHRLMQHWHQVLPGKLLDVSYEGLVEKPEMILRVVCSFLGIRYASSLRMGLQLHKRSVGRGHRYLPHLPALEAGLEPLKRRTRSA